VSGTGGSRQATVGRRLAGAVVAVATALVVTGAAIALFFNPAWVSFAQGRADAAAYTGWTAEQVDAVTRDIVLEVWLGPGTFAQEVAGAPVFDEREKAHMADVRGVVLTFYAFVAAGAAALIVLGLASRGAAWFWRAAGTGAKLLAVGTVAVGTAFVLFFDTAFTIFHQLFFAQGTWTFDPASDRLVQLFPYQFWTETSVAIAVVILLLAVAVWLVAHRLGRPGAPAPAELAGPAPGGAPAAPVD
jgi:integral membrane protein (TIGR01906 family)